MKTPNTGIVFCNWNRLPITKISIESLIEHTTMPYRLVVVDNNSTDDFDIIDGVVCEREEPYKPSTQEYFNELRAQRKIHHLLLNAGSGPMHIDQARVFDTNYGLGFARNAGANVLMAPSDFAKLPLPDFLFFVDSDFVYKKNWLENAYKMWNIQSKSHALGCFTMTNCPEHWPKKLIQYDDGMIAYTKEVSAGGATLMPLDVFVKMGGFPTNLNCGNEDWYMCAKMKEMNLEILNTPCLLVHIGAGHSLWRGPEKT